MQEIRKINRADPWEPLKRFTSARIALGRAGSGIPLNEYLKFKLAHAHARDAVFSVLKTGELSDNLKPLGLPVLHVKSKAADRQQYLQRPDLGRQPDEQSLKMVRDHSSSYDISIIIADGLCANAVNNNAFQLAEHLVPLLVSAKYRLSPLCIAEQARVAFGDHIGSALGAELTIMLIGERPGLSSFDSIGAYITYGPLPGLTDESRNCISNIRSQGLPLKVAAHKIFYLLQEAFKRKLSGVQLKDNSGLIGGVD